MAASFTIKRASVILLGLLMLAPAAAPFAPAAQAAPASFADPAFQTVWSYSDKPVADGLVARSWTWGPQTLRSTYEPYAQGPGGQHLVSYFDKTRMEINDPAASRDSMWFVTNGLLVVDMVSGSVQVGNNQFINTYPANIPVAGDPATSVNAPTYAALAKVASLHNNNRAPSKTGLPIAEGLGRNGNVGTVDNLMGYAKYGVYEPTLGHNIADVFWSFMNQSGPVYMNGSYQNAMIVPWVYGFGYPITEPYWIEINVSGQNRWVLMQAFQRRILTYSPQNAAGWQVEMGNVGLAYYTWHYGPGPLPTPTPVPPTAAAISLSPSSGGINNAVTVSGAHFPANAAVTIIVEKSNPLYSHLVTTVAAQGNGTFSTQIKIPLDAQYLGSVTIAATANSGSIRATAPFTIGYSPVVVVSPHKVVTNGSVTVKGEGFPVQALVSVGMRMGNGSIQWQLRTHTDNNGDFDATMSIGNLAPGTGFRAAASSEGGYLVLSDDSVKVLAPGTLSVAPNTGPLGAYVTLQGIGWPSGYAVTVGTHALNSQAVTWFPTQVMVNSAGYFSMQVYISTGYAGASQIQIAAFQPYTGYLLETSYYVTAGPAPTPTPGAPTVSANPTSAAAGQTIMVTGSNWQASSIVNVGVGRPGMGVEEWLGSALCDGARNFWIPVVLGSRWANAGQLVITATIPGNKTATTTITIVGGAGRVTPAGLPMTVKTYDSGGLTQIKVFGEGWRPGGVVHIKVVSANGSVNTEVATSVVKENGSFDAAFYATAPWAGRPDLGVQAIGPDGSQYSLRYLPTTISAKVGGTNSTHNIVGANWPANTRINIQVNTDNDKKADGPIVAAITTDANGAFSTRIDLPRIPPSVKNDVVLTAENQPYTATFDF